MPTELERQSDIARLYRATATPRIVDVPEMTFVMIDGHGNPDIQPEYAQAIQALFSLSYWLKFAIKRAGGPDHKVGPLESLWWAADMSAFGAGSKAAWEWTALMRQPDGVTADLYLRAVDDTMKKKQLPAVAAARLESFSEGRAGQILHVGPYAAEAPTINRLHAFLREQGYHFDGTLQKHHEIYLGDPRRSAPDKLRTIIRQPVV